MEKRVLETEEKEMPPQGFLLLWIRSLKCSKTKYFWEKKFYTVYV